MIFLILSLVGVISGCSTLPSISTDPTSPTGNTSANVEWVDEEKTPDSLAPFLEKVSKDHQIPLSSLQKAFEGTKTIPSIKKLVMPPPPGFQKNWKVYRSRFVEPRRLAAGQKFWKEHRSFIEKTSKETGVPAEIIVAIIGVETIYGRHMGNFSVKDTLTTLGFDYPNIPNKIARETLFKNQLEDLILLCWSDNQKERAFQNCLNQKGSYAGAIGLPQFMPGSIRRFATDGNRDGKIDLRNSPEDAIASVGQFLKMHGWVKDEPIYLEIQNHSEALSVAQSAKRKRTFSICSSVISVNTVQFGLVLANSPISTFSQLINCMRPRTPRSTRSASRFSSPLQMSWINAANACSSVTVSPVCV